MLTTATLVLWCVTGVVSYIKAKREAGELLDGQLSQSAKLLLGQVRFEQGLMGPGERGTEVLDNTPDHPYEQPLDFQVWDAGGHLLLRSDDAPPTPMARAPGYTDIIHNGHTWRMLSIWGHRGRFQVQVAQPAEDRERVALEVATQVAIPIIVALPLLALLIYLSVRRALRPLDAVTAGVAARTPENLEPLPDSETPEEVRPLVGALNRLLARLRITLDNERRFTADAAHELRTPLAALKVQAQVAMATPQKEDRDHALTQMVSGVERTARLVDQLLRLARLDPLQGLQVSRPVELTGLIGEVEAELISLAERLGQHLVLERPAEPIAIDGDGDMLHVALRNLVENALRYSPRGSTIRVGLARDSGEIRLWVEDDGPGVAQEELERLTERFYRGRDVTTEGSGLGLAIVQRVAKLHGARLDLRSRPEGGLSASLVWPAVLT